MPFTTGRAPRPAFTRVFPPLAISTCLLMICALASCRGGGDAPNGKPAKSEPVADAADSTPSPVVALLQPTAGNTVSGEVEFIPEPDGGVRVVAKVVGLHGDLHGFHVHERGDCSARDGTSAGGHFNPDGSPHGSPLTDSAGRHVGDLGNLAPDPSTGIAAYDRVDEQLSLSGPRSIVGKSVIVHAGADDLESQPTGAAGARIACGVIVVRD